MKTTLIRNVLSASALLAVAAIFTGCNPSYAYHERIVSTGEHQVTTSDEAGLGQETHEVAPDAKIILDGENADLAELESGDAVRVKTEQRDGKEVATEIKAVSTEKTEKNDAANEDSQPQEAPSGTEPQQPEGGPGSRFEPAPPIDPEDGAPRPAVESDVQQTFQGRIHSLRDDHFVIVDDEGNAYSVMVDDETAFTLDEKAANFSALSKKDDVKVVVKQENGSFVARQVTATTP